MNRADYQSLRDFLGSVRHARLEQERLTERVLELEAQCTRLTAQMRQTPGGGTTDTQMQWASLADERRRLTRQMYRAQRQEREVQNLIDRVRPELYRDILTLRYIDLRSCPETAEIMARTGGPQSERHLQRLHGAALQAAQRLWDEEI